MPVLDVCCQVQGKSKGSKGQLEVSLSSESLVLPSRRGLGSSGLLLLTSERTLPFAVSGLISAKHNRQPCGGSVCATDYTTRRGERSSSDWYVVRRSSAVHVLSSWMCAISSSLYLTPQVLCAGGLKSTSASPSEKSTKYVQIAIGLCSSPSSGS